MLQLITPDISHKTQWEEIMVEWDDSRRRPWIFFQDSYEIFLEKIRSLQLSDDLINNIAKSSFYFLEDSLSGKIVGFYWFRHHLKYHEDEIYGGHIGYGIRPSERGRGYAKEGLRLLLQEVKGLGFEKVFIACDDDNISSAKVIEANGGILEKYTEKDNIKARRYWISIS